MWWPACSGCSTLCRSRERNHRRLGGELVDKSRMKSDEIIAELRENRVCNAAFQKRAGEYSHAGEEGTLTPEKCGSRLLQSGGEFIHHFEVVLGADRLTEGFFRQVKKFLGSCRPINQVLRPEPESKGRGEVGFVSAMRNDAARLRFSKLIGVKLRDFQKRQVVLVAR